MGVPAPPGNMRHLVHGANSEVLLRAVTEEVAEELIGQYPWVCELDIVAIDQYCRSTATARLLRDHIHKVSEEKGVEAVSPGLWSDLARFENNAMKAAEALGLNPAGRLKIAKDAGMAQHFQGVQLGSLVSQGRAMREAEKRHVSEDGEIIDAEVVA